MSAAVTRRIDDLGRIVLPHDARSALDLAAKDAVQIIWEGEEITIRKARPVCKLCGSDADLNACFGVCRACMDRIKAE